MATVGQSFPNLIDMLKLTNDGKRAAQVIQMLSLNNPILDDAIAVECNMGTLHRHTIATGLPSVAWGAFYQGIPQSKARTQQVDDTTGFLEAYSAVDKRLVNLKPALADAYRLNAAAQFLEAMNQEMATGIFYHDTTTSPEKFKGVVAHGYNKLATTGPGGQIVDAGGVGADNTSIWFITWGTNFTHLIYPEGTQAGIKHEDKGEQKAYDSLNNPYFTLDEMWTWHIGLVINDWRFNVRIANIDVSDTLAGTVKLFDLLRKGYYKLQNRRIDRVGNNIAGSVEPTKGAIYCNRDILQGLDALATNSGSGDNYTRLRYMEIEGKEVLTYRGWPIRETDAILNTEARVV